MIGPVSAGASFLSVYTYASAPGTAGVTLMNSAGGTATARSTSSIVNLGGTTRGKLLTAPSTLGWYVPMWDTNGTALAPAEAVLVGVTSTTQTAVNVNGVTPATFVIKRNDTDPSIAVQCLQQDSTDSTGQRMIAWPIPSGATVRFTMRDVADFSSRSRTGFTVSTPKVHATASVDDATTGLVSYGWTVGDTDTDGAFRGEFEVTTLGGEIRTFPSGATDATNYIAITITDDLDPGIT